MRSVSPNSLLTTFFYRTAIYSNMSRLLGALKVAKTKGNLEVELKKIERCQLLILDDAFLVPLDVKERVILLDIIEDRHERKSIILSSQLPVSSWYDAIGDPTVADAVLDRIVHTAHQIELIGESVRKIKAGKKDEIKMTPPARLLWGQNKNVFGGQRNSALGGQT